MATAARKTNLKVYCNTCHVLTTHRTLVQAVTPVEYTGARDDLTWDGGLVYMRMRYSVIICAGCDDARFLFEQEHNFYAQAEIDSGVAEAFSPTYRDVCDPSYHVFYPVEQTTVSVKREFPRRLLTIEKPRIIELLRETYSALNVGCMTLAIMGTRSIAEMTLRDVAGAGDDHSKTFGTLLDEFKKSGKFGISLYDSVKAAVDMGHAAVHRGLQNSDTAIIGAIMDNLESVLYEIYVRPKITGIVENNIPPRNNKMRGGTK